MNINDKNKNILIDDKRLMNFAADNTVPFYHLSDIILDRTMVTETTDRLGVEPENSLKVRIDNPSYEEEVKEDPDAEKFRDYDLIYITEITSPLTDTSTCIYFDEETGNLLQLPNPDYFNPELSSFTSANNFKFVGSASNKGATARALLNSADNKERFKTVNPTDPTRIIMLNLRGVERGYNSFYNETFNGFEVSKDKNIVMFAEFDRNALFGDKAFVSTLELYSSSTYITTGGFMSEEAKIYLPITF